ncbi:MAG TPA: hypothetical protein VF635_14210 [Propionibacteriaceae bacterium]|jgi:hypothetical protein
MSTVANGGDGLSRMVQNPKRYFAEARARAAEQVDAEMKRGRQRRSAGEPGGASPSVKGD